MKLFVYPACALLYHRPEPLDDRSSDMTDVSSNNHPSFDPFKCTTITFSDQVKLFVGRLHPKTTESDLTTYFSQFGSVEDAQIITNKKNTSKGNFGFITFAEIRTINRDVLNTYHFLHGRMLDVQIATTPGQSRFTRANPSIHLHS
ncbi:unnamed protein product [Dibothriocephalus latus]|uniref:RRM domain-containing protein n=1 Tax=Dibothriocephalus latus TaxID=60516 RepID=A0A3P7NK80_DIBLA|nr:unnamed protein product [Dibothriocephalus latus]